MANITTELSTIYNGVFGEDIRMAIYNALDKVNKDASSDGSLEDAFMFKSISKNADLNALNKESNRGIYRILNNGLYSNLPSEYDKNMAGFLIVYGIGTYIRQELVYLSSLSEDLHTYRWVRSYLSNKWSSWSLSGTKYQLTFRKDSVLSDNQDLNDLDENQHRGIYKLLPSKMGSYTNLPTYEAGFSTIIPAFLVVYVHDSIVRQEIFHIGSADVYQTFSWVRSFNGVKWSNWVKTGGTSSVDPSVVATAVANYISAHPIPSVEPSETISIVTPQMYGAIANGVTDCSTGIANAISGAAGKTVYFPAGTYNISSPIITAKTHAAFANLIFDPGAIIKATANMNYMLHIGGMGTAPSNEKGYKKIVRGGTFETNGKVTNSAILIDSAITDVELSNCTINCSSNSNNCVGLTIGTTRVSTDDYIHHVNIKSNPHGQKGVVINSSDNNIDYMRIYYFKTGIEINAGAYISHVRTLVNPLSIADTVSFLINSPSVTNISLDRCYGDSSATFLRMAKPSKVNVDQCQYFGYTVDSNSVTPMIGFDLTSNDIIGTSEDSNTDHFRLAIDKFDMHAYRLASGSHVGILVDSVDGHFFNKVAQDRLKITNTSLSFPSYLPSGDILRGSISDSEWLPFHPTIIEKLDGNTNWYKLGTFQWGNDVGYAYDIEFIARSDCRTVVPIYAYFNSDGSAISFSKTDNFPKLFTTDSATYYIGFKQETGLTVNGAKLRYISVYIAQSTTNKIYLQAARINMPLVSITPATSASDASQTLTSQTVSGFNAIYKIDCGNEVITKEQ